MIKELLATMLMAWVGSWAAATSPALPNVGKTMIDANFECIVPKGWSPTQTDGGLRLTGPTDKNKISPLIVVRYVPIGDKTFANADDYLRRHTDKSFFNVPGQRTGPVTTILVAGRKARRFVEDSSEFVPPSAMNTKEVPIREEHAVVPAAKGFYVLVYYAPKSIFTKNRAAFQKVLAGFKPKL